MLEKGKRQILKLLSPVKIGELKCSTKKLATVFKDELLDPSPSSVVLLLYRYCVMACL